LKRLGLSQQPLSTKEHQYIDKWLDKYAMPLPVVLEACDITISRTIGKTVFFYCDRVLTHWHKNGVVSLDDVKRLRSENKSLDRAVVIQS